MEPNNPNIPPQDGNGSDTQLPYGKQPGAPMPDGSGYIPAPGEFHNGQYVPGQVPLGQGPAGQAAPGQIPQSSGPVPPYAQPPYTQVNYNQPYNYPYAMPGTLPPPKKSRVGLIVTLVVVALLLCCCCMMAFVGIGLRAESSYTQDGYHYDIGSDVSEDVLEGKDY